MQCRVPSALVLLIVLLSCNWQAYGIKLTFESFEQTLGQDIVDFDLRVRKYNRTSSVLNGTIHLVQDGINDYQFHVDVFYSRLGNQQFNHMPIKLPTAGICDFIDNMYESYPKHVTLVVNLPEKGECPITTRDMYIFDTEFPTEVVPQIVLRNGLWKALMRGTLQGKEVVHSSVVLKATDN